MLNRVAGEFATKREEGFVLMAGGHQKSTTGVKGKLRVLIRSGAFRLFSPEQEQAQEQEQGKTAGAERLTKARLAVH